MVTSLWWYDDKAYRYLLFCRYAYMIPSVLHERYWFGNVDPWRAGWYTVTSLIISENFLTVCITRTYNLRQLYSVPSKNITIWNLYLDFTGTFCVYCVVLLHCIRRNQNIFFYRSTNSQDVSNKRHKAPGKRRKIPTFTGNLVLT